MSQIGPEPTENAAAASDDHHLSRQLNLHDMVFSQVLCVVGSAWVGIAAGLGHAHTLVWLLALVGFYLPMAAAVYYLNREMPLEGGLYVWARRSFGDATGFLVAWNVWAYGLIVIASIFSQLPTEFAYMAGPSLAWVPENHLLVLTVLALLLVVLGISSVRGLALGKWVHNVAAAAMILAFALLIAAPFWARLHHVPIHYDAFSVHLPKLDLTSLALIGQIFTASSGLEYIAIMAGEAKSPTRDIGRSIWLATPICFVMFMMGTGSVLAFHELTGTAINYIAPIPQALSLAFGGGAGRVLAKLAILLLQIRILGSASYIFTGVTRLPMTAGWDHLIPAWFSRLHPRFRTPTNSILVSVALVFLALLCAFAGAHAAEAFAVLNNASSAFYNLAYIAMFAIPIAGLALVRNRIPRWVAWLCGLGITTTIFSTTISAYPFLDVADPRAFALKFVGAVLLVNAVGYGFYRLRNKPQLITTH